MKSTQFVCKETGAMDTADRVVSSPSRVSESYDSGDRESVYQRFGSFLEDRASLTRSGVNERDLSEVTGLLSPGSSSKAPKTCLNIPKVDFSTFSPVLGTKFFCFHPSNFATVSEEIVSYLNSVGTNVNYDYDDSVHVWKVCENVDFESAVFSIALFEDSTKDKIFVKFHRLSGACGVFSSSVERFSRQACVGASELKQVNPTDLTETRVTIQTIEEGSVKKRKGAFKAMPLPLNMQQKTITCPEFLAYCEIFNLWSHSDIPECLASLLSSMPKMWRDLMEFYETVEQNPSSKSMGELVTMFASINKIYKNLCAIAVQSHNSMLSVEHSVPVSGLEALSLENAAAHPAVIITDTTTQSHDPSSYDYLDYDEVDGSAGLADDHMFGAHAAAGNHAHRSRVTLDVTRSHYRSMAVFEQDSGARFTRAEPASSAAKAPYDLALAVPAATTFEVQVNAKSAVPSSGDRSANNESMYSKLLQSGASPSGLTTAEASPEVFQFADLLAQHSKEDLSSILYLTMACICEQFSCFAEDDLAEGREAHFDKHHYLTRLLKSNAEFISVLDDIASEMADTRVPLNSFGSYRSKDIKLYANQLNSLL